MCIFSSNSHTFLIKPYALDSDRPMPTVWFCTHSWSARLQGNKLLLLTSRAIAFQEIRGPWQCTGRSTAQGDIIIPAALVIYMIN